MIAKTAFQCFKDEGITIGINLGNTLDAVRYLENSGHAADETAWGNPVVNQAYFNGVRDQGFKIVRIPVTWLGHTGPAPDFLITDARLRRIAEVAGMAHNAGLKVIINIHHDCNNDFNGWLSLRNAIASVPEQFQITVRLEKMWAQIAGYFADCGDWLMFEAFNDASDGNWDYPSIDPAGEYGLINNWNQLFSDTVRAAGGNNEKRYLIFSGYGNKPLQTFPPNFKLPEDPVGGPGRQVVSFISYEPWLFTIGINHQWNVDGSIGSKAYFDDIFSRFKSEFVDKEIPVIIGECGPFRYSKNFRNQWYSGANVEIAKQNRLDYIDYVYGKARENGLTPLYWETGDFNPENTPEGDSSLFNRETGEPNSSESAAVIRHMMDAVR